MLRGENDADLSTTVLTVLEAAVVEFSVDVGVHGLTSSKKEVWRVEEDG
jgi:hypothetical protein